MTKSIFKQVSIVAIVAAILCVPIVVLFHKTLMPSDIELTKIDVLVTDALNNQGRQCTVVRQSRPDRVESIGQTRQGYFTYLVHCSGSDYSVRAYWRIENNHIEIVKLRKD